MLLRFFFIIGFVFLATGCPRSTVVQTPASQMQVSHNGNQQTLHVANFTKVNVKGMLNVSLHTGYKHPQVILRGDPRDLATVITSVANGQLRVAIGSGHPQFGAVQVEIDGRYLNAFEYHGTGVITGSQLRTGLLDVVIENPGRTTLQGQIGLRKIEVKGGGYTEISGINSPYLAVNISGKSTVKLTGVANITTLNMVKDGRFSLYLV